MRDIRNAPTRAVIFVIPMPAADISVVVPTNTPRKKKDVSEWKIVRSFVGARALSSRIRSEYHAPREIHCAVQPMTSEKKRGISRVERWAAARPSISSHDRFSLFFFSCTERESGWDNRRVDRCRRGEESSQHTTRKKRDRRVGRAEMWRGDRVENRDTDAMEWRYGRAGKPASDLLRKLEGRNTEKDRQARYKSLVQRKQAITTKVHEKRKEIGAGRQGGRFSWDKARNAVNTDGPGDKARGSFALWTACVSLSYRPVALRHRSRTVSLLPVGAIYPLLSYLKWVFGSCEQYALIRKNKLRRGSFKRVTIPEHRLPTC